MTNSDTKTCPFCAETIKKDAKVCRYCHIYLSMGKPLGVCKPIEYESGGIKRCEKWVNIAQVVQTLITIGAIIAAAWWFLAQRHTYPHVNLKQKISHVTLNENINIMRLEIELKNVGKKNVSINKGVIYIQQILPLVNCDDIEGDPCALKQIDSALGETKRKENLFDWPLVSELIYSDSIKLEPGEIDLVDFEFAIATKIEFILSYVFFYNEELGKEVGWRTSQYYNFSKKMEENK